MCMNRDAGSYTNSATHAHMGPGDFIPNLGGTVAEGTPTSQLLQLEH